MSAYKSDLQRQYVRKDVIIEQAACATPQRRHYKESEGRNEATEDALEATAQLPTRRRRVRFSIEFLARKISQQSTRKSNSSNSLELTNFGQFALSDFQSFCKIL